MFCNKYVNLISYTNINKLIVSVKMHKVQSKFFQETKHFSLKIEKS